MVNVQHPELSVRRQCGLLAVNRSNIYYEPAPTSNDTELANEIHDLWLKMPFYGYRRITAELKRRGHTANHKCILREYQSTLPEAKNNNCIA